MFMKGWGGRSTTWISDGGAPTASTFLTCKGTASMALRTRVVDALRRQTRGEGSKLWTCGLQQPPLLLALANRTAILRRDDLEIVDPAKGVEACAERNPKISVHSENKNSLRTRAMRREGGDRDAALGRS